MAIITAENRAASSEPSAQPVPPVLFGAVFGREATPPVGANTGSRFVDRNTLEILSAGVLKHRKVSLSGRINPAIGVRRPIGGGGGPKDRGDSGHREREQKCASPGCNNPARKGDNLCASCRELVNKSHAASNSSLGSDGSRQVPRHNRRHG